MKRLETPQLILRAWAEEDAKDLYRYAKDPEAGPAAGRKPHENMEESREVAKMFIREGNVWALEEKVSGRVIGFLGLHKDKKRPGVPGVKRVGYILAKEFWGQERMTEAVKEAMRYAFEEEGLRMLMDEVCCSLTVEEWKEGRGC